MLIIGWKQISVFLQCSPRTAKRYHLEFGMPLLRFPTKKPAIDPEQIKNWLREYSTSENHTPPKHISTK